MSRTKRTSPYWINSYIHSNEDFGSLNKCFQKFVAKLVQRRDGVIKNPVGLIRLKSPKGYNSYMDSEGKTKSEIKKETHRAIRRTEKIKLQKIKYEV
jgi:hypothetical protein